MTSYQLLISAAVQPYRFARHTMPLMTKVALEILDEKRWRYALQDRRIKSTCLQTTRLIILIALMIAVMLSTFAVVVVISSVMIVTVHFIMIDIDCVVPIVANKIDRHSTCAVLSTVLVPTLFVTRGDV